MKYCTIINYYLYLKLFKSSSLTNIIIILWQTILILIKLENLLVGNTIGQVLEKMLKPMSKAATLFDFKNS